MASAALGDVVVGAVGRTEASAVWVLPCAEEQPEPRRITAPARAAVLSLSMCRSFICSPQRVSDDSVAEPNSRGLLPGSEFVAG